MSEIKSEYRVDNDGQRYHITEPRSVDANGNPVTDSSGAPALSAKISEDAQLAVKTFVTPTIYVNSGATSSVGCEVLIDPNNGTAGLKHIEDATPTEAEVYDELVGFEFDSADNVKTAYIGLLTYNGLGFGAVNEVCPASHLVFTINGAIADDATKLLNGYPDVGRVMPNEVVKIQSSTAITRIACIAKRRSGAAAGLDTYDGLITCEGYAHDV